jgi:RNA polymerase sigma factor (sigma-70 family)
MSTERPLKALNGLMTHGEHGADELEAQFSTLWSIAYRVSYRLLGTRSEAEDVAAEALARAVARWSRVAIYGEAWVARVATNLALSEHRRRDRRATNLPVHDSTVEAVAVQRADLIAGLRRLSRRQRDVVVLRYLADRPESEVAAVLGCSAGTVKQHASRALNALRIELSEPSTEARDV